MNGLRAVNPMAFVLTRDMAGSIRFYTEVLGQLHLGADNHGTVLDLADVQLRAWTPPLQTSPDAA